MNKKIKHLTNALLDRVGLRLVNAHWGPRGFQVAFSKLKDLGHQPAVIYDVGASDGSWSMDLADIYPKSKYLLFEPLSEHEASLRCCLAKHPAWEYHACALGAENSTMSLHVHGGQSSFLESEQWKGHAQEVKILSVDSAMDKGLLPQPELIKIDVQGFEMEVLKGAETALKSCAFLFLELSWLQIYEHGPYAGEVLGYLAERGFHVFDICTYSMRPRDGRLTQSDILLAHERTGLFACKYRH